MKFIKFTTAITIFCSSAVALGNQNNTFEQYTKSIGANDGDSIVHSPMIRPNGELYYLHGKISTPTDGKAEFTATLSASQENQLQADIAQALYRIPQRAPKYFYVIVSKSMQAEYFENARVNVGFDMVGKYISNFTYKTIAGEQKMAPVFAVEQIFMWNSKNNPFKVRPEKKQVSEPKPADPVKSGDAGPPGD